MSREEAKEALKAYMTYNAGMTHHTYGWCTALIDQIFDEQETDKDQEATDD